MSDPDAWLLPMFLAVMAIVVLVLVGPSCSISVSIDSRPAAVKEQK